MVEDQVEERLESDEEEEGGPVKSFLEHLEDLRWVLIKTVVALGVGMLICLIAGPQVVNILTHPLSKAKIRHPAAGQKVTVLVGTNKFGPFLLDSANQERFGLGTNKQMAIRVAPMTVGTNRFLTWEVDNDPTLAQHGETMKVELLNLGPASGFIVAFQVAFYGGMVLAAPFIFYFVAAFVFPALKMNERYYVYRGLGFGVGLFMLGVAFCYFALMPLALSASQAYSQWLGFSAYQWKADEYISFVCKFMLGMGIGFEMPVVVLTLVKIGVLNYTILSKGRRYMIVVNLVLGAVLTTPEVITQVVMFIPLQTLYEISIWVAWYWERKEKKLQAAAEQPAA